VIIKLFDVLSALFTCPAYLLAFVILDCQVVASVPEVLSVPDPIINLILNYLALSLSIAPEVFAGKVIVAFSQVSETD